MNKGERVKVLSREEIAKKAGIPFNNLEDFHVDNTYYNPDMEKYAGQTFIISEVSHKRYSLDLPYTSHELRWEWAEDMLELVHYGLGDIYE